MEGVGRMCGGWGICVCMCGGGEVGVCPCVPVEVEVHKIYTQS